MNKGETYIRDGRSPIPEDPVTSRVMRANKDRNTKPELKLRKALWAEGIRGYRLHWKKAPGKPDIAFPGKKIAIFVNGCYWHRCPHCDLPLPKRNVDFWKKKFAKNVKRDVDKIEMLKTNGWKVIVIWECMIKNDIFEAVSLIKDQLKENVDKSR